MKLFTDVYCDTEPEVANHLHKEAAKSAGKLEMTAEVTSDQSEGQGCAVSWILAAVV